MRGPFGNMGLISMSWIATKRRRASGPGAFATSLPCSSTAGPTCGDVCNRKVKGAAERLEGVAGNRPGRRPRSVA